MPSDTDDDDEERLDCVHDIHNDGEEADIEEIDGDDECETDHQVQISNDAIDQHADNRPLVQNDSSMDGDIEDADGHDTDRRFPKRHSLFNKLQGVEQQSSYDQDQQ